MAKSILALPQEIWTRILFNLDAVSLIRCAKTCKFVYNTLQGSSQLAYTIQLYMDGFERAPTSATHHNLIQRLLHHRQAWLSFTPHEIGCVTLEMKLTSKTYELVGGAFANINKQHFQIAWLPTAFQNGESPALQRTSVGMPIRDFVMDPTQDLIVFLETDPIYSPTTARNVRVHIRTISTNTTHPLARESPLQVTIPSHPNYGNAIYNTRLRLAGNTLALYFHTLPQKEPWVHIWDWSTSCLLVDSSNSLGSLLISSSWKSRDDFDLLDSNHCFFTSLSNSGSIQLYKFGQSPSVTDPLIHLATLHFPPVSLRTNVRSLDVHAGPIEANPLPHKTFVMNDDDRLHVFTAKYYHSGRSGTPDGNTSLNIFVHQRVFIKYCARAVRYGYTVHVDIPWSTWGPSNTHLVSPAVTQPNWQRFIHGQRVIYPALCSRNSDGMFSKVHILDFSRAARAFAKGVDATVSPGDKIRALTLQTTCFTKKLPCLQKDVTTRLPYVSSMLDFKSAYSAYMIYGDGVVGVTSENDGSLLLLLYPILQEQTPSEIAVA